MMQDQGPGNTSYPRAFRAPPGSYFLLGPRGTGKSVFLRQTYPRAHHIDLLEAATFRTFSAHPERLEELVTDEQVIVVDKVQRLPELLPVVHRLIESHPNRRFILTGSSARKLRRVGTDLLAGRALLRRMHPFVASELGSDFDLERALRQGLLPLVWSAQDPAETLRSYVALYIKEEVQAEGLVRNVGAFARFLEAASFSHAQVISTSSIARECQVERKTVEGYLEILTDLLLCFRLPVFQKRARRKTTAHPKFYFFDTGVFRSLRPSGPLDRPTESEGPALEGLVAQHLRATIDLTSSGQELFFHRTTSGLEIDFILYGENRFDAIEVKNLRQVRPEDLRSLLAFSAEFPEASLTLLYRGKEKIRKGPVLCLPVEDFLLGLP